MALTSGSCRFGLWHVQVWWSGDLVHRVRFSPSPIGGRIPTPLQRYLTGRPGDPQTLLSVALEPEYPYSSIYRRARAIPYGETVTYGSIARELGTSPRLVGLAMKRNPTPLVIPCHRVVASRGPGGFTPSPEIKEALIAMEKRNKKRLFR